MHVPGELGFVRLTSAVNLIGCPTNDGSSEVAHELKSLVGPDSSLNAVSDQMTDASSELNASFLSEGVVDSTSTSMDRLLCGVVWGGV